MSTRQQRRPIHWVFSISSLMAIAGCPPSPSPDGNGNGNDNACTETGGNGSPQFFEAAKLSASDPEFQDLFSDAIAIEGDHLLVGTRYKDSSQGAVYSFRRLDGSWTFESKIIGERTIESPEGFGKSIAIEGTTAVIGAETHKPTGSFSFQDGAVYFYERTESTWVQQQLLAAENPSTQAYLGSSVDIDGDWVVAGSPGVENLRGSALILTRTGGVWRQHAELFADDGINFDRFGDDVAIDGDTVAIGAPVQNFGTGAVYIFQRSGDQWTQAQKLLAPVPNDTDQFGLAVALEGDTLVVSAPLRDNNNGPDGGEVYIYERRNGQFALAQTILPDDGEFGWHLGGHLAIDGNTLAVASEFYSFVILFERQDETWREVDRISGSGSSPAFDSFGRSVALDTGNSRIAVGAPSTDTAAAGAAGVAYVFEFGTPRVDCPDEPDEPDDTPDNPDAGPVFRRPRDLAGLFAADEPWTLAASDLFGTIPILITGVGDLIEAILIGEECAAYHPAAELAYDGTNLTLITQFPYPFSDGTCGVHIFGDATACEPPFPTAEACTVAIDSADELSDATAGDEPFLLLAPEIARIPACNDTVESIGQGQWGILNIHFLGLLAPNLTVEDAGGVVLSLAGDGSDILEGSLCTGFDNQNECIGCIDTSVSGSVDFDGDTISVDIDLSGGCSLTFTGTSTYCAFFSADPSTSADVPPLIRIDGSGTYRQGSRSGSVPVLYLVGAPDQGPPIRR